MGKAQRTRLQTNDLGVSGNDVQPVHVHDHLTQQNKKILSVTLKLKKQRKGQFLWTDDCLIKARKTSQPCLPNAK